MGKFGIGKSKAKGITLSVKSGIEQTVGLGVCAGSNARRVVGIYPNPFHSIARMNKHICRLYLGPSGAAWT